MKKKKKKNLNLANSDGFRHIRSIKDRSKFGRFWPSISIKHINRSFAPFRLIGIRHVYFKIWKLWRLFTHVPTNDLVKTNSPLSYSLSSFPHSHSLHSNSQHFSKKSHQAHLPKLQDKQTGSKGNIINKKIHKKK